MEIGSAYALQVCLLQIPALVFYSALQTRFVTAPEILKHTFSKSLHGLIGIAEWLLTLFCSVDFPSMGHGDRDHVRLSPVVHVRRRQEQLLQGLNFDPVIFRRGCWVLLFKLQRGL